MSQRQQAPHVLAAGAGGQGPPECPLGGQVSSGEWSYGRLGHCAWGWAGWLDFPCIHDAITQHLLFPFPVPRLFFDQEGSV